MSIRYAAVRAGADTDALTVFEKNCRRSAAQIKERYGSKALDDFPFAQNDSRCRT